MSTMIEVDNVEKHYLVRGKETVALKQVSLSIREGEVIAFVGPSGCGKSTLLNMIAGIIPPSGGTIFYEGKVVSSINSDVGYMTQADSVLPWRTVGKNISMALEFRGMPPPQRAKKVEEMLELVDLLGFERAFPKQLSGGMRKRVALAQMLSYEPRTLLLDEPFGALDSQLKLLMQQRLLDIWERRRNTMVFVTHDLSEAVLLASKVVVFSGRPGHIKHIEEINIPYPRDVFKVRFLPAFERAYSILWAQLEAEIKRGEDI